MPQDLFSNIPAELHQIAEKYIVQAKPEKLTDLALAELLAATVTSNFLGCIAGMEFYHRALNQMYDAPITITFPCLDSNEWGRKLREAREYLPPKYDIIRKLYLILLILAKRNPPTETKIFIE